MFRNVQVTAPPAANVMPAVLKTTLPVPLDPTVAVHDSVSMVPTCVTAYGSGGALSVTLYAVGSKPVNCCTAGNVGVGTSQWPGLAAIGSQSSSVKPPIGVTPGPGAGVEV